MAKENAGHKNLKPAVKGEPSRNPKGRPVGSLNIKTMLRKLLEAKDLIENPKESETEAMRPYSAQLIKKAFGEDVPDAVQLGALKEIADRMDGKAIAKIEQTIKDDRSVEITFEEITDADQIRPKDSEDQTPDNN